MRIDVSVQREKPIPIPIIGYFLQSGLNIVLKEIVKYQKDILLSKPNDYTYIEKIDDETFQYSLIGGKWVLMGYDGDRKKNRLLLIPFLLENLLLTLL